MAIYMDIPSGFFPCNSVHCAMDIMIFEISSDLRISHQVTHVTPGVTCLSGTRVLKLPLSGTRVRKLARSLMVFRNGVFKSIPFRLAIT